jgi:thiol:disulfide interchange protein DsbD
VIEQYINNPELYLQGSIIMAYVVTYVAGIGTGLTPCVYPVIPITVAYIGAHQQRSSLKGFTLSLAYVLGIAITYTALGGFAAFTGTLFGQIQTNPWLYFVIANICIIMGLSMLNVFMLPVRIPAFFSQFQPRKRGMVQSFLVGAMSGLIVGPCMAPVLAVLLTLVASKQSVLFGMTLLFVFALGMGTLLIAVGTFSQLLASIPKSGRWMTVINKLFGLIMIGMGEYFLIQAGLLWI